MKFIFLDIDGVLNSTEYMVSSRYVERDGIMGLDPHAVARLNSITDKTGARLVVTSTMRLLHTRTQMCELLRSWGVTGLVQGMTPVLPGGEGTRSREIDEWLKVYSRLRGPCQFVVVDDSVADVSSLPHIAARVVGTTCGEGLRDEHVVRILAMLEEDR